MDWGIEQLSVLADDPVQKRGNHLEQREKLGLNSAPKVQSNARRPLPEPTNALQKVEVYHSDLEDMAHLLIITVLLFLSLI